MTFRVDSKSSFTTPVETKLKNLAVVRRVLGQRFTYHHVALSDRSGNGCLYVPVVGKKPVPGEASLARVVRRAGATDR